jgi:competence protein ComEA
MNHGSRSRWRRIGSWLTVAAIGGIAIYVAFRPQTRAGFTPLPTRTAAPTSDLRRGFQGGGVAMAPPQMRTFKTVDLNEASVDELQTLPQITAEYARKIVAGRPYRSIEELARTGIPREILDQISPPGVIRVPERGGPVAIPVPRGMPPAPPRGGPRP